mmetsp:Transcript_18180/g.57008  ORF Transcript_18180/g.57008 Transcript_18180/m.57008 type:complete len:312 (+) Transcript_18180:433-1368(+)
MMISAAGSAPSSAPISSWASCSTSLLASRTSRTDVVSASAISFVPISPAASAPCTSAAGSLVSSRTAGRTSALSPPLVSAPPRTPAATLAPWPVARLRSPPTIEASAGAAARLPESTAASASAGACRTATSGKAGPAPLCARGRAGADSPSRAALSTVPALTWSSPVARVSLPFPAEPLLPACSHAAALASSALATISTALVFKDAEFGGATSAAGFAPPSAPGSAPDSDPAAAPESVARSAAAAFGRTSPAAALKDRCLAATSPRWVASAALALEGASPGTSIFTWQAPVLGGPRDTMESTRLDAHVPSI